MNAFVRLLAHSVLLRAELCVVGVVSGPRWEFHLKGTPGIVPLSTGLDSHPSCTGAQLMANWKLTMGPRGTYTCC